MAHQAIALNVLGYQEEGEWVALALEMDLRGYGGTFEAALADLGELVAMQIGFAQFKGQPEMVWKAAQPIWFERFAEARREHLEALGRASEVVEPEYSVAGLPIPPAHVIEGIRQGFARAEV